MAAAQMPGVSITPFHVEDAALPDGDAPPQDWEALLNTSAGNDPQFLLLADPFSVRGEFLLMGLDYAFPGSVKIGGLASGGIQPGANALFLGDEVPHAGMVGLAFSGDVMIDTVVAQGCRPIGAPMQITECQSNVANRGGRSHAVRGAQRGVRWAERSRQAACPKLPLPGDCDGRDERVAAAGRLPHSKHRRRGRQARSARHRRDAQRRPDSAVPTCGTPTPRHRTWTRSSNATWTPTQPTGRPGRCCSPAWAEGRTSTGGPTTTRTCFAINWALCR